MFVGGVSAAWVGGCASNECNFHSQCGRQHYCDRGACRQDCRQDFDCPVGRVCDVVGRCVPPDGAVREPDGGGGRDAASRDGGGRSDAAQRDAGGHVDAAQRDAGRPPPSARYLDDCGGDEECVSGRCGFDLGGRRACSRACGTHAECAHGHVCSPEGWCVPSDVGTPCSVDAPERCVLGVCLGRPTRAGYCTRPCRTASECPAGYACSSVGGARVCIDIEKPCTAGGEECETGLCIPGIGCSASCASAADCPATFTGLGAPPYTCDALPGAMGDVCIPPGIVEGDRPIGRACGVSAGGANLCRSAACDDETPLGPICTQACDPVGGCPPGFGCMPQVAGGRIVMGCVPAGTRGFGRPCSRAADCATAICEGSSARCSRLCLDGRCPNGWRCEPVAGTSIAVCRPPAS